MSKRHFDCPKCGEVAPSVAHHRWCIAVGWPFKNGKFSEHLHLVCSRCGYDWTQGILR